MLDQEMTMRKLEDLSLEFAAHIQGKRYRNAKDCYETARTIAVFMELPRKERDRIFGIRGERGVILQEGMFPEEMVMKAMYEVDVKGGRG